MATFDPLRIMRVLGDHGVNYVVVGGIAASAQGSPALTDDMDICYEREPENLERLASALKALGARLRGVDEDVPFLLDAKTLRAGLNFTFETDAGPLDCLGEPAGTRGYPDLAANGEPKDFNGLTAPVASVDDLIRMKRAAARPIDLVHLEILGALREEMEGEEYERG